MADFETRRQAMLARVAEAKTRLAELELETAANLAACAEASGSAELERLTVHHGALTTERMVLSGVVDLLERQRLPGLEVEAAQANAQAVTARGQALRQERTELQERRAKLRETLDMLKGGQSVPGRPGNAWAQADAVADEIAQLTAHEGELLDAMNANRAASVEAQARVAAALAARDRAAKPRD